MIKYEDLVCKLCIYDRDMICAKNNKVIENLGIGCGEGEWLYRDFDNTISTISWIEYWLLYGEEGEFYNEETQARERTGKYYWKDVTLTDWREM